MTFYKSLGTTGTREGLSDAQKDQLKEFIRNHVVYTLHHGDCVGSDDQVARAFSDEGTFIIAYPGNSTTLHKAHSTANDLILPWQENLVRNRKIVNSVEMLLAFPSTESEVVRSGTWATIRYANKRLVPVKIITPSGRVRM